MTAFIDVDDTLVIFGNSSPHPYGVIMGDAFEPNHKLIERIKKFNGDIVVWSGGGSDYARKVAKMVLPEGIRYIVRTKGATSLSEFASGDIIVDDQTEYYTALKEIGVHVFSPFDEWDLATKPKDDKRGNR